MPLPSSTLYPSDELFPGDEGPLINLPTPQVIRGEETTLSVGPRRTTLSLRARTTEVVIDGD